MTPEHRAEVVRLFDASGRSVSAMARELGIDHWTLWQWVNAARLREIDPDGELTREQRNRIRDLEKENSRLRRDLELVKKAGALFRELDRGENSSL
ncbi:transposase [Rathayibacter rathayi]|uniref:transposase n=1 Tax=Rathayibacter rathayi TaxID=33887 RepID=UPI0015E2FB6C|nr:transposase [Rathayibacter rathayi]